MTFWNLRLAQRAEGAAWWQGLQGLREYFAYHGVWAPGVRLLRRMSVRHKLILVMGIVAAPLLPLTWQSIQTQNELVAGTTRQLSELHMAGAIAALGETLNSAALAADGGQNAPAEDLMTDWTRLQASHVDADASGLVLQQAWERHREDIDRAVQMRGASREVRIEAARTATDALLHLREALSSVNLQHLGGDPEIYDSNQLAVTALPDLQIALSRLNWLLGRATAPDLRSSEGERHALQMQVARRLENVAILTQEARQRLQALRRGSSSGNQIEEFDTVRSYLLAVEAQVLTPESREVDSPALRKAYEAARAQIVDLQRDTYSFAEIGLLRQLDAAQSTRLWVVGLLLGAITLAGYLLYCFFLVMRGGLNQLNSQMRRMSEGDLSARPLPVGGDEVAATMQAMNTSLVRLSDLMASVRQGVGSVNQASNQVAMGNNDLTARNRETAHSVAAVVDGVARYTAQLEACGRQVEAVVNTVQLLRMESAHHRKQMSRLRERMSSLRVKSREIGDIVTLIDAIAFRTNILALNASVEAGKAGEAGRGFAVVAQEVRSLALRGAESARRIGDIVARSTDDIEFSGDLANETGVALASADEHVDQIRLAMDDVSALTAGGERESAEILRQLTRIHEGTSKSLVLVEQLAQASSALRSHGERLAHKVGQFRLS